MTFKYIQSSEISQFKSLEWIFLWLKHHIDHSDVNRFQTTSISRTLINNWLKLQTATKGYVAKMKAKLPLIRLKRMHAKRKATINHAKTLTYQTTQIILIINQAAFKTHLQKNAKSKSCCKNIGTTSKNNNFFFSTRRTKTIRSIITSSSNN